MKKTTPTWKSVDSNALSHLRTDSTLSALKNDYASDIAVLIYSDEKASLVDWVV